MDIGRVGIWTFQLEMQPAARVRELAAEIEALGYGALWFPEAYGRESFTLGALLLHATRTLPIASGITNMWGRDAMTMAAAHRTLSEAFPDRFVLGIGVSHAPIVEGLRGHRFERPLTAMREYLDAMDRAPYMAPQAPSLTRVLGALAPKMLALAAEKTQGAHPYFVPVEHTAFAREVLGRGPLLAPEQAAVLEKDPTVARTIARTHMAMYLGLPNYVNNLRRLGWSDDDLAGGGSDRLVDALVVWGDVDAIVRRVHDHHAAGADHVCVQVLSADPNAVPLAQWRELAPALLA